MLSVQLRVRKGAVVLVDPDGDTHTVRSPEELWSLVRDLASQRQGATTTTDLVVVAKPDAPARPLRTRDVQEVHVGTRARGASEKNAEPRAEVFESDDVFSRIAGQIGAAGVRTLHDLSASASYRRRGRNQWG